MLCLGVTAACHVVTSGDDHDDEGLYASVRNAVTEDGVRFPIGDLRGISGAPVLHVPRSEGAVLWTASNACLVGVVTGRTNEAKLRALAGEPLQWVSEILGGACRERVAD